MIKLKFFISFLTLLLVVGFTLNSCLTEDTDKDVKSLKIAIGIFEEEDVEFFKNTLKRDDIVFTWGAKTILSNFNEIQTMIAVGGAGPLSKMELALKQLRDSKMTVDYITYNPEKWQAQDEINNLLESIATARTLVNKHGQNLKLGFGTDRYTLEIWGERVAPLVDQFGIQLQRYQKDSIETFRKEAIRKVGIVRKGSKDVPIFLQLSLAPKGIVSSAEEVLERMVAIKDMADGVSLLYTKDSRSEMKKLIRLLR